MKKVDAHRSVTKKDLDELESHIIVAVGKTIEEAKTEIKTELGAKIDKLSYDVSDFRNRVIDLEIKHGTPHGTPHGLASASACLRGV